MKMYMEYLLYLSALTKTERNKQILMIVIFWIIMLTIAWGLELLKYKYKGKTKNKKFQKFLEMI